MQITEQVRKIIDEVAARTLQADIEAAKAKLTAYTDSYQKPDDEEEHEGNMRALSQARDAISDPHRIAEARRKIRASLEQRAEALPEPNLPRPPSPVPPRRVPIILERAWYHHLPVWMWDLRDHEREKQVAAQMAAEMRAEFEAKVKAYEEQVAEAYKVALDL